MTSGGEDEFQWGEVFRRIEVSVERDTNEVVSRLPAGYRGEVREGMKRMMDRMKDIFKAVSDGVARERLVREAEEQKLGVRLSRMEEQIEVVKGETHKIGKAQLNAKIRASEVEMEKKVEAACCALKLQDIEFDGVIEDGREIVRSALSTLRGDIHPEDRSRYERLIRRTRVVVLGKRTEGRRDRGRSIFTVPILLELGSYAEAEEMRERLRRVGYFSSFHWPSEIMEFVNEVREEVRCMGFSSETHYVRIRPEFRGGDVQIRADVKGKDGGRWGTKAVWVCPPLDKRLWPLVDGLYDHKIVGRR